MTCLHRDQSVLVGWVFTAVAIATELSDSSVSIQKDWTTVDGVQFLSKLTITTTEPIPPYYARIEDVVCSATVDSLANSGEAHLIGELGFPFALARGSVHAECEERTKQFRGPNSSRL